MSELITLSCLKFDPWGILCDHCAAGDDKKCTMPITLRKDSPLNPSR